MPLNRLKPAQEELNKPSGPTQPLTGNSQPTTPVPEESQVPVDGQEGEAGEEQELQQLHTHLKQQAQEWKKRLEDPVLARAIEQGHVQVSPMIHKLLELWKAGATIEHKEGGEEKEVVTKAKDKYATSGIPTGSRPEDRAVAGAMRTLHQDIVYTHVLEAALKAARAAYKKCKADDDGENPDDAAYEAAKKPIQAELDRVEREWNRGQ